MSPPRSSLVHRFLLVSDLLTMPRDEEVVGEFLFGNPLCSVRCVRVSGVIVELGEKRESKQYWCMLDDGTGIIYITSTKRLEACKLGVYAEFIGELKEEDGRRLVRAYGFSVKDDPMSEVARMLELVKLYRDHYFEGGPSSEKTAAQAGTFKTPMKRARAERVEEEDEFATPRPKRPSYSQDLLVSPASRLLPDETPGESGGGELEVLGAAVEAAVRDQGQLTFADIVKVTGSEEGKVREALEWLSVQCILYLEDDGFYKPL
eukprot:Colp12_sorted_trinity150504_noHs@11816